MSTVDLGGWERHNVEEVDGRLTVRPGMWQEALPTSGTVFVAGFTVESPSTTEPWHYLVEQSSTTGICTLRVYTEDMLPVLSYDLGVLATNPDFSYAVSFGQLIINSPQMSSALYGLVGGGITTALKQASENPDTTALEIPPGHVASFGDRVVIGYGRTLYFSDPDIDPRTYVAENTFPTDGQVLDLVVGTDGALVVVTKTAVQRLSADALGQGQRVEGFWDRVPGLQGVRPHGIAASNGALGMLVEDGIRILDGDLMRPFSYGGRRYLTAPVQTDDLRSTAQIFATPRGFVVGFDNRSFALRIDMQTGSSSFVWTKTGGNLEVRGVLKTSEGDEMLVMRDRVVSFRGSLDFDGSDVRGVLAGDLSTEMDRAGTIRGISVRVDSAGQPILAYAGGKALTATTATRGDPATIGAGDVIVGQSSWASFSNFVGRSPRSSLIRTVVRDGDASVEIGTDGAFRMFGIADIDVRGQGRRRRDRMAP